MLVSDLSASAQDYLKLIWSATEWTATPISVGAMAERLGVRPPTVSDGIKKLAAQGLVTHAPYGSIELTDEGRKHAVTMVRRHRLLETFLVQVLDYGWDEVHEEAEVLEHAVSDKLIERIDQHLGRPTRDPHGDPIPSIGGPQWQPIATQLSAAEAGVTVTVTRISDADPEMLRYFTELGLSPDTELSVQEHRRYADLTTIRLSGQERSIDLGSSASDAIWVVAV
ncbi:MULTISPECIES: metal-dependent transcriptional regulator [Paenarthrobacter]|jgi:DtxR family Mn-dependent transcriptional regulator|uniref:Manganese transport regulator n=1 Tax=Paenarthrobacter ureafaciens TaxID=37931 RepID=A0AAX3EPP8_PAEUR|nr:MULTISPECIES: metal-dependent transcriptional regulator [Paenarthrobacter]NKR09891.1 DtxR family transcriptional regulator [Arthrobacter sp. M5]NKR16706.1 DtxR family transcriptional regulator [Arthrobacter sp. M6]MCW3767306.1 metal-dependent transcriptional regulator [Paenarthrobacter sp. PAE-2]MDO5866983.1 metal-dependent transcriptional regulator [Paenarthrobacter sp. SD-2]MDO5878076.1 metal-dependent transcriptional regulator [Paenarthrobacter sp. SD-1]